MLFITSCLHTFGEYALFMRRGFTRPDRLKESLKRYVVEISKLGVDSIPLVIVISLFIGAVIAIQMQINFAALHRGSCNPRRASPGILIVDFVLDPRRQSGVQHCLGDRNNACDRAD